MSVTPNRHRSQASGVEELSCAIEQVHFSVTGDKRDTLAYGIMSESLSNDLPKKFSFWMQIGLTREQINVEGELSLAGLKEAACSFVDRKVGQVTW